MSDELPPCPECGSPYTYPDRDLLVCPECAHEWFPGAEVPDAAPEPADEDVIRDSVGNILSDGDDVIVVKTMSVKGAQQDLKIGTKVKNIRLVGGDHDIDCKIPGFGPMKLKSSIVKKA